MIELEILLADSDCFSPTQLAAQTYSPSTTERLARIAAPARRHQFLLGRWLMAQASGCSVQEIEESAAGYPLITNQPDMHASLSHSGRYVGIVVSSGFRCGLDIEHPSRERNWLALAERVFHPTELAWATAAPDVLLQRFYQIWTLREAAFKAGLRSEVVAGPAAFDPATKQAADGIFWHYQEQAGCFFSIAAPRAFSARLRQIAP